MTAFPEPPIPLLALVHIERTLADSYRKEIDQEENIWRSLPFFAATLALQLAALFQVIDRLPSGSTWPARLTYTLVMVSVVFSFSALGVLAASIYPAKFRYIAGDSALLEYALGLIEDERRTVNEPLDQQISAIHSLRAALARQYALATDNNRQINKRRDRRRSIAGLLTVFSVISTLMLVSATFATYVSNHEVKGIRNGSRAESSEPARAPALAAAPPPAAPAASAPADAGGHQGVVHDAGGGADSGSDTKGGQ